MRLLILANKNLTMERSSRRDHRPSVALTKGLHNFRSHLHTRFCSDDRMRRHEDTVGSTWSTGDLHRPRDTIRICSLARNIV